MKILKSELGGIMIQVMLVGGVLAGLAPFIIKSGLLKGKMSLEERQNLVIEETVNNLRGVLADSEQCQAIMNSGGWATQLPGLTQGQMINSQVNVEFITANGPNFSSSEEGQLQLVFRKHLKEGTNLTYRTVRRSIDIKRFEKTPGGPKFCISYESSGVIDSYQQFCTRFGGTWNSVNSSCDLTTLTDPFLEEFVYPYGCSVLGANLIGDATSGWRCDGVAINGDLTASDHFDSGKIDLSTVVTPVTNAQRTDFQNSSCSGVQIARSVNSDSSINCANITCPQPSTSTYSPVFMASENQIQCQCNRDSTVEKPNFECGDTDPNSCSKYAVNDGCGTGNLCEIQAGLTCNSNESCINGSCVCQPNCSSCNPAIPSTCADDGCGNACPFDPVCQSSCSCAASTPVGQTCGDGCGGTCQGQSCSHLDAYSFIGTAQNEEEWAKGSQVCREQIHANVAGSCQVAAQNDTEAGICKKFRSGTCQGNTAAVVENVADGTVCGDGKTCNAGQCIDLIQLQDVGWKLTSNFGSYVNCNTNEVATGMCSSGEDRDCKDFDGVRKSHGVHCAKLTGLVQIDQTATPQYKMTKEKNIVTCPAGYVVQSTCGSGKPFTCPTGVKGNYPHAVQCVKLDFKGNNLTEKSRFIYAKKMQRKTGFVKCSSNEFLTGLCSIGRHKWNCFGYAYIMRCTKYE